MGKSSPAAPAAPDPVATAQAQGTVDRNTAMVNAALNKISTTTPYGTTSWATDPNSPAALLGAMAGEDEKSPYYGLTGVGARQVVELTPLGQQAFNQQEAIRSGLSDLAATRLGQIPTGAMDTSNLPQAAPALDLSGLPQVQAPAPAGLIRTLDLSNLGSIPGLDLSGVSQVPGAVQAGALRTSLGMTGGEAERQAIEDRIFQGLMARQATRFGEVEAATRNRLANQGLAEGSEAYTAAMRDVAQARTDAEQQAALGALQQSTAMQQAGLDMEAQAAGFANAAQTQAFGQGQTEAQRLAALRAQQTGEQQALAQYGLQTRGLQAQEQAAQVASANEAQAAAFGQGQTEYARQQADRQARLAELLSSEQYKEARRAALMTEMEAARNRPVNELAAILQGAPALQSPSLVSSPAVSMASPDLMGMTQSNYMAQLNAYNQAQANRQASTNAMLGAAATLGAGMLMGPTGSAGAGMATKLFGGW